VVGDLKPANDPSDPKEIPPGDIGNSNSQEPVRFGAYDELGDATPTAHIDNPEPSVAQNGQVVMTTGNF